MKENDTTITRLLTLLNVSATKAGKRKWSFEEDEPIPKLNKRRSIQFATEPEENITPSNLEHDPGENMEEIEEIDGIDGADCLESFSLCAQMHSTATKITSESVQKPLMI